MPGLKRKREDGGSAPSTADLAATLKSFEHGDKSASAASANRLTRAVDSVRRPDAQDPLWPQLKSHLNRKEAFPELFVVLLYAEKVDQPLLIETLNLTAALLTVPTPHIVDAQDAIRKAFTDREANHLRTLGKALGNQQYSVKMVALRVISALLRTTKRARALWDGLAIDAKTVSRLLGTRKLNETVSMKRPDCRGLAILMLLPILDASVSASLKLEIIGLKGFGPALFKEMQSDPPELVEAILQQVWTGVLSDQRIAMDARLHLLETAWEPVVRMYAREDLAGDSLISDVAHRFLLAATGLLAGLSSKNGRRVLGGLLGVLKPVDDERQADVIETALRACPELLRGFWQRFMPSLEPRLSSRWLITIAFAVRIVNLPLSSDFATTRHGVTALLDRSLPSNLTKQWLQKGLQSGDNGLVSYMVATFLLASLVKAQAIIGHLGEGDANVALLDNFRDELRERVPEAQVIIALIQKAGGGGASDMASLASFNNDEEESLAAVTVSTHLRILELSSELISPIIRFDLAKLGRVLHITADPLACAAQASLLRLVASPTITVSWQKLLSPLISLRLSSPAVAIRDLAATTLSILLERSPLFEHDAREVRLWIDAFSTAATEAAALVYFETCLAQCLAAPWNYAEAVEKLTSTSVSPLLAVVLASLAKADVAVARYLSRLSLNFALVGGQNDVAAVIAKETHDRLAAAGREGEMLREADFAVEAIEALNGGIAAGQSRKGEQPSRPTPLFENVFAGDKAILKATLDSLSITDLLLHAVAARQLSNKALRERLIKATATEQETAARILLCAALTTQAGDDAVAFELLDSLVTVSPALAKVVLSNNRVLAILRNAASAHHVLKFVADHAKDEKEYATRICEELTSVLQEPGFLTNLKPLDASFSRLLPFYATSSLLAAAGAALASLAKSETSSAANALVILTSCLGQLLRSPQDRAKALQLCFDHFSTLFELHADTGVASAGALLAFSVECSMPVGLLPRAANVEGPPSSMQVFSGINVTQMTAWTKDILGRGVRDEADRQILRAAVYRHGESRLIVEEALAGGSIEAIATNVPLLRAYLETSAVVAASPHRALALDRAFEALVAMLETVANQQDTTRFEDLIISLQLVLDARPALLLAVRDKLVIIILTLAPSHLEAIIFRTIDQLCNQHQGLAPVLAAFVDRCMLWLVRRYAEDAEDGKQVVALADEMARALGITSTVRGVQAKLVDPVLQAIIQNRLVHASALSLAQSLVLLSDGSESTCLRLLRLISAHAELKTAITASTASSYLVDFIMALCNASPAAMIQSAIADRLLAFYECTTTSTDQALLELLRFSEAHGGRSLRALLPTWAPASIRKTSDGRGADILLNLDANLVVAGCKRIVRDANDEMEERAYEATFLLPLLALFAEKETIGINDWLSLASNNMLGLAVCCFGSPAPNLRALADRTLARLTNRLTETEFSERKEILVVLDHVRILLGARARPPALALLFCAHAVRGVALPEEASYATTMHHLLAKPTLDLGEVPLLSQQLYSKGETASDDRTWLLTLLRDGLCTEADWAMLRSRRVADLLLSLLSSGAVASSERAMILQILERATLIRQGANDLAGRRGLLSWPVLHPPSTAQEALAWLRILRNVSRHIEADRLHEANEGCWLVDLLLAVESLSSRTRDPDVTVLQAQTLRRVAYKTSIASLALRPLITSRLSLLLNDVLEQDLPQEATADIHDATIRCVKLGGSGSTFEAAVALAMSRGSVEVRQLVLNALHR